MATKRAKTGKGKGPAKRPAARRASSRGGARRPAPKAATRRAARRASASVFLNVHDIERSLAFYEALGFRTTARHGAGGVTGWADLELDGADLGLGNIASSDDPAFRAWVGTPLGAGVVVYFTVPDVDAIHDRAVKAGAAIEVPLQDRSYGRTFMLNDPDGYTVSFLTER